MIHLSYNGELYSYDNKTTTTVSAVTSIPVVIHPYVDIEGAKLYYKQDDVEGIVDISNNTANIPGAYLVTGDLQVALKLASDEMSNSFTIGVTVISSSGDIMDDDIQFTMDNKKRLILVPGYQTLLAIQFDNQSEIVTFKLPRYQEGIDLSTKIPYVNYRRPQVKDLGKALCTIEKTTEDSIYITWMVDATATQYDGVIQFQVEFADSEGYRWQSQIGEIPILASLYNTGLEPYTPGILEQYLTMIEEMYNAYHIPAGGTSGQVLKKLSSTDYDVVWADDSTDTSNYNELTNKPQINGTPLSGNKTASDLGLASASDTAALSDRIDALDDSRTHAMPFTIDGTGYINYSSGNTGAAAVYDYTGYVDVSACTSIMYKRVKSTLASSSIGIAFYNASKTYISGERCLTSQEETGYAGLKTIDVPDNAVYARFSTYHDTTTYGDFELYGLYKTPVVDSELSSTSTNAIQNKAVKAALDAKGTYSKPSGGIPASDLASGVIPTVPLASIETPSDLGTAAVGSSTKYARADHVHKMPSASDVGAIMRPFAPNHGDVLTWDGSAWIAESPASTPSPASSGTPAMDGTASRGSSAQYARADHVHPTDTSRLAANQGSANAGKFMVVGSDGIVAPVTMQTWQGGNY